MSADIFVDPNNLVYAPDRDAGAKQEQARAKLKELWRSDESPWISVQVLQEFFVNLCRLGVPHTEAREALADYAQWRGIENTVALCERGVAQMEGGGGCLSGTD